MLEDRKFFYPVTGDSPAWQLYEPGEASWEGEGHPYELLMRSPWMIIGDKSAVTMDTSDVYVGKNTPQIALAGDGSRSGLFQNRLDLERGRRYYARIVLSVSPDAVPIEVSLVWGSGASDRQTRSIEITGSTYQTYHLVFESGGDTDCGKLEVAGRIASGNCT